MHQNGSGGRAPPVGGAYSAAPDPLAALWGRGVGKGKGKGKGVEGGGNREGEKERGGPLMSEVRLRQCRFCSGCTKLHGSFCSGSVLFAESSVRFGSMLVLK